MTGAAGGTGRVPPPDGACLILNEDDTRLGWTALDHRGHATRAEPMVRSPHVRARRFASAVTTELAGMRVATSDEEVADELVVAGGELVRRASVMVAHPPQPVAISDPLAPP